MRPAATPPPSIGHAILWSGNLTRITDRWVDQDRLMVATPSGRDLEAVYAELDTERRGLGVATPKERHDA